MTSLWCKNIEEDFFKISLNFATPEQLFYVTSDGKYFAYWPKGYNGERSTLQSRNSLIGNFTEKWATDLIQRIIMDKLYAVQGAICDELSLTRQSPGDLVLSRRKSITQKPEDILIIFEVKMSIVWNWRYMKERPGDCFQCVGDYKSHLGTPGLLRSDSMLKAIGKSINIRVSSPKASRIPIVILGNTPITKNYYGKVDQLYKSGIIQGFWSVNPKPLDSDDTKENLKKTPKSGFFRFDSINELKERISLLYSQENTFFSGMKSKRELGKIIEIANREKNYEKKGEQFIKLIGE